MLSVFRDVLEQRRRVYGEDFRYEQFAPMFKAELWDPDAWCDLFARAGAKYVVTTANYHDGFAIVFKFLKHPLGEVICVLNWQLRDAIESPFWG